MKTTAELKNEITGLLTNAFLIIDTYHDAQRALNSFVGRDTARNTIYKGQTIRKILTSYFDTLAKKLTNFQKATSNAIGRAKFDGEELQEICMGHININEYDCERREQHSVESITSNCKFEPLVAFINMKNGSLENEGLRLAADHIVRFFELTDGRNISGKDMTRTARHFHLFSHLCYFQKDETARNIEALAKDLKVMSEHTGIADIGHNFRVLARDLFYCDYNGRLPSNTKYDLCGGLVTIYKHHIKFTITHQDFDALLTFVVTHKSADINLGKGVTNLAIAA